MTFIWQRSLHTLLLASLLLAPTVPAQSVEKGASIVVSRRELRITFAAERATTWGWPAFDLDAYRARGYLWGVQGGGVSGFWTLMVSVGPDSGEAHTFASLGALLAKQHVTWCRHVASFSHDCRRVEGRATAEAGRVVLRSSDTSVINEMYALRPYGQRVFQEDLGGERRADSVRVTYVAPEIPPPSDSLQRWVAARERRDEKFRSEVTRRIQARGHVSYSGTTWAALGDTLEFYVDQRTCTGDVCIGGKMGAVGSWTVDGDGALTALPPRPVVPAKTTILRDASGKPTGVVRVESEDLFTPPFRALATHQGLTTVRVSGLPAYDDSARVAEAPPSALVQTVIVQLPVARVLIRPRPDTIRVGAEPRFTADVLDAAGAPYPEARATLTYPDSGLRTHPRWYESRKTPLPPGGRRRVIATYEGKADTLRVFVADTLVASAGAQGRVDSARVIVSRREARLIFPIDTASRWGWAADPDDGWGYSWTLRTRAVLAEQFLEYEVVPREEPHEARRFKSLGALLAAGGLFRCANGGMMATCGAPVSGKARADHGHVVITARDSTLIADLFGLRPDWVRLSATAGGPPGVWSDSVRVEYVDPQIAEPTDSLRAWVAERNRLAYKDARTIERGIGADVGFGWEDTSWVFLGDEVLFKVTEAVCGGDTCTGRLSGVVVDSGWTVGDTTILGEVPRPKAKWNEVVVYASGNAGLARRATRLGITTVRAAGIRSDEDTTMVRQPPPSALTRTVVVRPPVARVVIHPRPDTVRAGEEPRFEADVFDAAGGLFVHAGVRVTYPDRVRDPRGTRYVNEWIDLPPNGRRRIVASYAGKADTLTVFVADTAGGGR